MSDARTRGTDFIAGFKSPFLKWRSRPPPQRLFPQPFSRARTRVVRFAALPPARRMWGGSLPPFEGRRVSTWDDHHIVGRVPIGVSHRSNFSRVAEMRRRSTARAPGLERRAHPEHQPQAVSGLSSALNPRRQDKARLVR